MRRNESKAALKKVFCEGRSRLFFKPKRAHSQGVRSRDLVGRTNLERTRWDPKDGDLCLARTKPGETLVEVRSDSDVQIDRRSWV